MNRRHDSASAASVRERPSAAAGASCALAAQVRLQRQLVASLVANPRRFGPECARVAHLETHISHVLLTGRHAYKIKKPVALSFLDFGTLDARRHFCEEELRLNRRLAPALYLDVVPIGGTPDAPVVGGGGPAIEYAVRMREFAQEALASRMLERGAFGRTDVDALAAAVAAFHARVAVAPADGPYGTAEDVRGYAQRNFAEAQAFATDPADRAALDTLAAWTAAEFAARADVFRRRRTGGFVRECHGDLHLGNIAEVDGELVIFDGIEFNDHLRWIDVLSEAAFATMDLEDRGRPDLAHRFLNAYLEATGDYAGLAVLRYYLVYRAMVRAKVAALRARQLAAGAERDAIVAELRGYLALAQRLTRPPRPAIVVTHGVAGCGKTTSTQALVELVGAVRVRTDVERKRESGLAAGARSGSAVDGGLYTAAATEATYARVRATADAIVDAGDVAIADGTFLARAQRDLLRGLAAERGVPFVILEFVAPTATLRERVAARSAAGTDASEADLAVLERQLAAREPLAADERADVVAWDALAPPARARERDAWDEVLRRIGGPSTAA